MLRSSGVVFSAVFLVSAVAGCGTSGPSDPAGASQAPGAAGQIQVWALQDNVLNPIETASVQRFNERGGTGGAKLATFGNDPYKQRLRVAIGSPNAPDVFFNWGGGNLGEYVDAGKVRDLTPLLDKDSKLKEAFLPSVLDAAKIDGKYYGLPMRGVQPVALFYNKKVFADAGAQPPKTWAELTALVETFKSRGVTPIALAGSQAWTELMWAEYLLDRIGGPDVFRAIRDGKDGAWSHPAVLDALTKIGELVGSGAFGKSFATVGYDVGGASTLLAQGRAAMHLMGSWEFTNQLGQSPQFVKDGNLGFVPFPVIEGGAGDPKNIVGNPNNFYSVSAQTKAPETAEKFLATALNEPAYVDALVAAGDVPAVTGVEAALAKAPNSEYTTWIYQIVRDAASFQLSWDQDLPADRATLMLTELQKLFLGDQTPQGFVDVMSKR